KFTASLEAPLKMYYGDFDANKLTETIVAMEKDGKYFPLAGMDELAEQMVSLIRKKYTNYKDFAGQTLEEIFPEELLEKAALFEVHELASGWLENRDSGLVFHSFPESLQVAPLTAFLQYDFNGDGQQEVLAAGNYFGVIPYHGRFDSFPGALIYNRDEVVSTDELGLNFLQKAVRSEERRVGKE